MTNSDCHALTELPETIIAHFENGQLEREVLSLYYDSEASIHQALSAVPWLASWTIDLGQTENNSETGASLRKSRSIIIDESVKLWPRIIGSFTLDELRALLGLGIFLDIKIFGQHDIKIEKADRTDL